MRTPIHITKLVFLCVLLVSYSLFGALAFSRGAEVSILNYNAYGIGASGTDGREALQRIVDYFDPDIIIFQEAKGTTYPNDFLVVNSDYEGYYSSGDGAHNRRMIMSKFDIIDESVREYTLDPYSYRTLYAATIDLPGPHNLEVFTAHWDASRASVRDGESAESAAIIGAYQLDHPNSLYIYAGDFNDEDTSYRITNLLDPNVGLNMFTPVDQNNSNNATINSDPEKGTYLDRRIDYILPSNVIAALEPVGSILNTWTYTAGTVPAGLELTDTIDASDHLPLYMVIDIPELGDMNGNDEVDIADFSIFSSRWQDTNCGICGWADLTGDGEVGLDDLVEFTAHWLTGKVVEPGITYQIEDCSLEDGQAVQGLGEELRFSVTVQGNYVCFEDMMKANCCPDELELQMTTDDNLITIYEIEYLSMPCICICDFPVTATLGPFVPGTYILEVYQGEFYGGFIGNTAFTIE